MVVREEQERVRTLLSDTITLLCRNGLSFKNEFNISAVIGITLDKDDVFLVDIRETIKNASGDASDSEDSEKPPKKSRKRRKRSHSTDDHVNSDSENEMMDEGRKKEALQERLEVKTEVVNESDDEDLVFIKNEPGIFSPNVAVSDTYSLQGNRAENNSTLQSQGSQPYQDSGGQWNNPVLPPTFDPSTLGSNPTLQQPPLQQGQSPVNLDASIAQEITPEVKSECSSPLALTGAGETDWSECLLETKPSPGPSSTLGIKVEIPTVTETSAAKVIEVTPIIETPCKDETEDREQREGPTSDQFANQGPKLFKEWLAGQSLLTGFEKFCNKVLATRLSKFYKAHDYSTAYRQETNTLSLPLIRSSINSYLRASPYNRTIDIINGSEFAQANQRYAQILRNQQGTVTSISHSNWARLQNCPTLDNNTPKGLQWRVWLNLIAHFGYAFPSSNKYWRKDTFKVAVDMEGREYVTRTGEGGIMEAAQNHANCPVESFKKYLSKLHPSSDLLFTTAPVGIHTSNSVWYTRQPLGMTKLDAIIPKLCAEAGLSRSYDKYCLKAPPTAKPTPSRAARVEEK